MISRINVKRLARTVARRLLRLSGMIDKIGPSIHRWSNDDFPFQPRDTEILKGGEVQNPLCINGMSLVNGAISKFLQTPVNCHFHALLRSPEQASNGFVRVLSTKDVRSLGRLNRRVGRWLIDRRASVEFEREVCGRRIYWIGVGSNWCRFFHRSQ